MNAIDRTEIMNAQAEYDAYLKELDELGLSAAVGIGCAVPKTTSDEIFEVNHRPTAQQWPVCIP